MKTLENHINRKYSEFDLSDDSLKDGDYEKSDWKYHVPSDIVDAWKILQSHERFLVALMAEFAIEH